MMTQRLTAVCLAAFVASTAAIFWTHSATGETDEAESTTVYELRTYTTHPGRLPALHKRFSEHTMRLFAKHGMKNVIYWTPMDDELKDNTLVYVIAHKSRDAARASWDAFRNDPEWKKAAEESQRDGKIVMGVKSQYLTPTDYSPHK